MLKIIQAECPCCGANQDYLMEDDTIDIYFEGDECITVISGYCDKCDASLIWEDVYKVSERYTNLRQKD